MLQLKTGEYLGVNKQNWDADTILVSETVYRTQVFEGWHYHENSHISFILQGGNREQRKGSEFEVYGGQIMFYESGELHRNLNTKHLSRNINIEIESGFFSKYDLDVTSFNSDVVHHPETKFTTLKVYQECLRNDKNTITGIHELFLNLLGNTLFHNSSKNAPNSIMLVRDILNDRWNENVSLDDLANLIQTHPVTIAKLFPKYFGYTTGEYVRKIRVEKAISMIRESNYSLTEIAYQCGFFDQSHFIRIFKEITGLLPNSYKKM